MRSKREETYHLLATDFPRHSSYTERCWTQFGGKQERDAVLLWALRGVGAAATLQRRSARRLPIPALVGARGRRARRVPTVPHHRRHHCYRDQPGLSTPLT